MKNRLTAALLVLLAACAQQEPATPPAAASTTAASPAAHEHHHDGGAPSAVTGSDPQSLKASVLDPESIQDLVARDSYIKAKQVADRLDQMYCYCHCSRTAGHKSLLTCFQTTHAVGCLICQQEATQAWTDWKQGNPVDMSKKWSDDSYNGGAPPPKV